LDRTLLPPDQAAGEPESVTATARKLACIIYHLLKYQEDFVLLDNTVYEAKVQTTG